MHPYTSLGRLIVHRSSYLFPVLLTEPVLVLVWPFPRYNLVQQRIHVQVVRHLGRTSSLAWVQVFFTVYRARTECDGASLASSPREIQSSPGTVKRSGLLLRIRSI